MSVEELIDMPFSELSIYGRVYGRVAYESCFGIGIWTVIMTAWGLSRRRFHFSRSIRFPVTWEEESCGIMWPCYTEILFGLYVLGIGFLVAMSTLRRVENKNIDSSLETANRHNLESQLSRRRN